MRRVLGNRIRRWTREATQAGQDAEVIAAEAARAQASAAAIAARLAEVGVVDDAAFALMRARRLRGAGRSGRAALAHLAAKGVPAETAREALAHEEVPDEFTAALVLCRKRRFGPFAAAPPEAEQRRKWLGTLARAGFSGDVAHRALNLPRAEAEAALATRR